MSRCIWNPRRLSKAEQDNNSSLFHGDKTTEQTISSRGQRIVDSVMKAWNYDIKNFCCTKDWPGADRWNRIIKGRQICDDIWLASAKELEEAMKVFRDKECLLGLVLIAGLSEGYVRDDAVAFLNGIMLGHREQLKRIYDLLPLKVNWSNTGLILEGDSRAYPWNLPAEFLA